MVFIRCSLPMNGTHCSYVEEPYALSPTTQKGAVAHSFLYMWNRAGFQGQ